MDPRFVGIAASMSTRTIGLYSVFVSRFGGLWGIMRVLFGVEFAETGGN